MNEEKHPGEDILFPDTENPEPGETGETVFPESGQQGSPAPRAEREFRRGVLFGMLLSGIVVMTVLLIRYGTLGTGRKNGAAVLTSGHVARKLREVQNITDDTFLYDVDGESLETWMFKGIAAGLGDPYANYFSADEMDSVMTENEGSFYGIGISFARVEETDELTILSVYEDSPAMKAGLEEGDVLIAVNGTDVTEMDAPEVSDMISAVDDDSVLVRIRRGGQTMEIRVSFDTVSVKPVHYEVLDDGLGYIELPQFSLVAVEEFEHALEELMAQNITGLIVDLRNNPGGLLSSVTDILDDLLPEGVIVSTKTRNGGGRECLSDEDRMYDGPVAVLVSHQSASAAEIFAGAVQDYGLGPVVGETTFGKGVVQRTYSLQDGSALKLTTETYYTPLGREIDAQGIEPDLPAGEDEDPLLIAREALGAGWQKGQAAPGKPAEEEAATEDAASGNESTSEQED